MDPAASQSTDHSDGGKFRFGRDKRFLLPRWIRCFSWLFVLYLAFLPLSFVLGLFGVPVGLGIQDLEHVGSPFAPKALLIESIFLVSGIAGFGLLWGKRWAIDAGLLSGLLHLAMTGLYVEPSEGPARFQTPDRILEALPLVALELWFLVVLWKIRKHWRATPEGVYVDPRD